MYDQWRLSNNEQTSFICEECGMRHDVNALSEEIDNTCEDCAEKILEERAESGMYSCKHEDEEEEWLT